MKAGAACGLCGKALRPGYRTRDGSLRCARHTVLYPSVLRRSLITAAIVGTVLTVINQGDRILSGEFTPGMALKMGLTYCVPFAVSTSGALGALRRRPDDPT